MRSFEQDLTTLAFCWRLTRRDGVRLGLTSHDHDLWIDGLRYRSAPGLVPSAIERNDGLTPGSVDIAGALASGAITAADLNAGRWDGAHLRLSLHDWTNPAHDPLIMAAGRFGTVTVEDGQFTVELETTSALLDCPVAEETSPLCRAELGDVRCRVDLARHQWLDQVVTVSGAVLTLAEAYVDDSLAFGRVRWLSGANAGLESWIAVNTGAVLTLAEPPVFLPFEGDRAIVLAGCDKSFAACRDRFANALNFQGEPHLPGNDVLTRYGG